MRYAVGVGGAALHYGDFGDAELAVDSLDYHLAGRLHAGGLGRYGAGGGGAEPAQAAVEVAHGRAKEELAYAGQQRRSDVSVKQRI